MVLTILFWAAVGVIVYTYAMFPVLLFLRGLCCKRPYQSEICAPSISVIIIVHNESEVIGEKLENILSLSYPAEQTVAGTLRVSSAGQKTAVAQRASEDADPTRIEIVVGSDGSTDGTEDIVRSFADRGVRLVALPRRGKIPTLNATVAAATGEILVFTDANSMLIPNALHALLAPFADPNVGGVAGNQVYAKERSRSLTAGGECAYWNFDRMLKRLQSRAGSVTSATGALYAVRRSLFRPVPPGVTDDFVCSTNVIAQGKRLVFAPEAIACEPVAVGGKAEFGRKVRVMTRGLRAVLVMRQLLNPLRHGFYSLQLFSHKVLRRVMVFPLILLLVVAPILWDEGLVYQWAAVSQMVLYGCAGLGLLLGRVRLGNVELFTVPFYFCMVNVAAIVAVFNTVRGRRIELWEPKRQPGESETAISLVALSSKAERSSLKESVGHS